MVKAGESERRAHPPLEPGGVSLRYFAPWAPILAPPLPALGALEDFLTLSVSSAPGGGRGLNAREDL